jgi:hypothetical protein
MDARQNKLRLALESIIGRAVETAKKTNTELLIVELAYPESDSERFQYAPAEGCAALFRYYTVLARVTAEGQLKMQCAPAKPMLREEPVALPEVLDLLSKMGMSVATIDEAGFVPWGGCPKCGGSHSAKDCAKP